MSNEVILLGKIRGKEPVKYLLSGVAVLELEITYPQEWMGKKVMGSVTVVLLGEDADLAKRVRIGQNVDLAGHLWSRKFRGRDGKIAQEVKVICNKFKII